MPSRPIAVVGAGFSGTLTALHLLARTPGRQILLCERNETFGRGIAYGTRNPGHLLNVRASNMSAFPDRPDHFVQWLERSGPHHPSAVRSTAAGTFVSRQLYGSYLTGLLREALSDGEGAARLILIPDEVIDVVPSQTGHRVVLAGGRELEVAGVVLASGHGLPQEGEPNRIVADPWASPFTRGLEPDRPVVVIGSGLTMVDIALQLHGSGFGGPIVSISRRGLTPHAHAATEPWPAPALSSRERAELSRLMRHVRRSAAEAETAGAGWRSAVDSLRPMISELWQSLEPDAQRRFLRHARPWWEIHRHRMAVPVGQHIGEMVRSGQLDVRSGWIQTMAVRRDHARVVYRPRGQTAERVIEAQRVIVATGARAPGQCDNKLLDRLLERGLARPDRHRLGLDLDKTFAAIGSSGRATPGLWVLGPLAMGVLWECTAVPDIRQHAVTVADEVAASLQRRHEDALASHHR